jgi:hypothetical protein
MLQQGELMSRKVITAYAALAITIFLLVERTVQIGIVYVRAHTVPIGELTTVAEEVDLGNARSVEAEVELGLGELALEGGASALLEAEYTTNVTMSLPVTTYSVENGRGLLRIEYDEEQELGGIPDLTRIADYVSRWNLALSDDVPLDLAIAVGKGTGHIDLRSIDLATLEVDVGQGDATIDLRGEWHGGPVIEIGGGQGALTVDLRGTWHEDAVVDIHTGMGSATVLLPSETGVVVHASSGIGGVNAVGLVRDGNRYVNSAFDTSDVTLSVDVSVGVGDANLTVLE